MARPISTASIGRICNTTNTNVAPSTTTTATTTPTTTTTTTTTNTITSMENDPLTNQDSKSTVVDDEKVPVVDLDALGKEPVSKQPLEDLLPDDMDMVMMTPTATTQPLQVRDFILNLQKLETKS